MGAVLIKRTVAMKRAALVSLASVLLLASCGGESASTAQDAPTSRSTGSSSASQPPNSPATATPSKGSSSGLVVKTADSKFGTMLFDETGQAIYLFAKEATSRPHCYGPCADAWPPVLTKGSPRATGGVRSDLLGTTERTDGSTQVTYAGHPLYFYAHEGKDQVLCHKVNNFGGLWLVVTPGGRPAA